VPGPSATRCGTAEAHRSIVLDVLPTPLRVRAGDGQLALGPAARVAFDEPGLGRLVERICGEVGRRTGLALGPAGPGGGAADDAVVRVELADDPDLAALPAPAGLSPVGEVAPDERYALTIDRRRIVVRAGAPIGAARGLTTLVQLLATADPGPDGAITLPAVRILDGPRFAWRGLSLDLARTFFPIRDVRRVVDLVALYKFSVLHLHLTDDEGWRLAAGRPPAHRQADGTFYTDDELRDLVAYAAERFVTIVPEVDTPGHAAALVRLRPELDNGRNLLPAPGGGQRAWLDPDHPGTLRLVDEVYTAVAGIFPGRFIHIGGDEALGMPRSAYERFARHVRPRIRSLGKRTLGWQESMRAGADPGHVVQYWISRPDQLFDRLRRAQLPPELVAGLVDNVGQADRDIQQALAQGVPIIVSPLHHCYLDVPYGEPSADPAQEERRARVGLHTYAGTTVADTYAWEPVAALGPGTGPEHMAGVEAAVWCETVEACDDLAFLLLPRLPGVADKAWSDPRATSWADHRGRLAAHARLWDQDGLAFFKSSAVDWGGAP
jgi:hexosaminidase